MKHARLSCSNLRWPECPGSIREEEQYVDVLNEAAITGVGCHLLLELCLNNNCDANVYDQQIIGINHEDKPSGWLIKSDHIERVQMCIDYVNRRRKELIKDFPDSVIVVESEQKTNPGDMFGRADWWGTLDIVIFCTDDSGNYLYCIEVIDYKDGREYVDVQNNTQLISYLLGEMRCFIASGHELVQPFNTENVGCCRITIVQPKTNPVVRYEKLKPERVMELAHKLALTAKETDKHDAQLYPGKHCRWCLANPKRGGHCTAPAEQSLSVVKKMNTEIITTDGNNSSLFKSINKIITDPKNLNNNQLTELADAEDGLLAAFQMVKDEIKLRIEQGQLILGYVVEPGRNFYVWNEDEKTIVKKLKSRRLKQGDIYPSKLVSVAALMKNDKLTSDQKEKIENDLVTVKAGKLVLKKVSHKEFSQPFVNDDKPQVSFF